MLARENGYIQYWCLVTFWEKTGIFGLKIVYAYRDSDVRGGYKKSRTSRLKFVSFEKCLKNENPKLSYRLVFNIK